ncbi:MAG: phytanoyl-CoA dioxygenase family protein [Planctomycetaceae bacterium]|nr:phytanoyl-CoA dioxygenase family protein [Planctomycetaceae bacterium]
MMHLTTVVDEMSLRALEREGCLLLQDVFSREETELLCSYLDPLFEDSKDSASIRNRAGLVYAARNVLQLWPDVFKVSQQPRLNRLLDRVLGSTCGLVRVLYFDKPPGQTWALPWHKDITIAVTPPETVPENIEEHWTKVRSKAGVPHVEADVTTLSHMLTLRVHLDPARSENGALSISPGSHHSGKELNLDGPREMVFAEAGDVFVMRPMLSHCSGQSTPMTPLQRRILHLEFATSPNLPHGFEWHTFLPVIR